MAPEAANQEEVVLAEEAGRVRVLTLNRPRQLNVISDRVVALAAGFLEKWERDEDAELVIIKGSGRAFSAGGDLRMFYDGRLDDSCLEVAYRMYWLCDRIHSYKKTQVSLVHGIVMGGGGAFSVPSKFSVVTEKTVFAVPEASIGFHTDCSFSYILSHLPGNLGEFFALTGARLSGKEMVSAGFATHFVPSEKINELEERLLKLNTGNEDEVRTIIEEFKVDVQPDKDSVINKLDLINKCFSKETVEEIISSLESEAGVEENRWIVPLLKGIRRSSPTALKITLRSVREGRGQTLAECLKREFRITMNILRSVISEDVYEGIRALTVDKDNAPKWNPPTLEEVSSEKLDLVFQPFKEELELNIPAKGDDTLRWSGKYEDSIYPELTKSRHSRQALDVLPRATAIAAAT